MKSGKPKYTIFMQVFVVIILVIIFICIGGGAVLSYSLEMDKFTAAVDPSTLYKRTLNATNANLCMEVHNGFGDRMMDIIGLSTWVYIKSESPRKIPQVLWRSDPSNPSRQYDTRVVDLTALSSLVRLGAPTGETRCSIQNTDAGVLFNPYNVLRLIRTEDEIFRQPREHETLLVEIAQMYIALARRIKLNPNISSYVPKECRLAHAIHLRRTDKLRQVASDVRLETNIHEEHIIMDRVWTIVHDTIGRNSDVTYFYVLSDDPPFKEQFIKDMKSRYDSTRLQVVSTSEDDLPSEFRSGYDNAYSMFDFFCLSQCRSIIQATRYSTFSTLAAIISQNPLHNVVDPVPECLLNIWKPCLDLYYGGQHFDHVVDLNELKKASKYAQLPNFL